MSFCKKYFFLEFLPKIAFLPNVHSKINSQPVIPELWYILVHFDAFSYILVRSGMVRIRLTRIFCSRLCSRTFENVHVCPNQNPDENILEPRMTERESPSHDHLDH